VFVLGSSGTPKSISLFLKYPQVGGDLSCGGIIFEIGKFGRLNWITLFEE
jgi:hypothetical protein